MAAHLGLQQRPDTRPAVGFLRHGEAGLPQPGLEVIKGHVPADLQAYRPQSRRCCGVQRDVVLVEAQAEISDTFAALNHGGADQVAIVGRSALQCRRGQVDVG